MQRTLITVHGIRTFGQWQARLSSLVRQVDSSIATEDYGYGYFSVVAFVIPPLRWLATRAFRRTLERILDSDSNTTINIVAHSFGTHLVGHSLRKLSQHHKHRIHTVILAGSVLRSDFPWAELIDGGVVVRVVNECGTEDAVLLLSQFLVLFTGMAGRVGFTGTTNDRFVNRYYGGGHSHYFDGDGSNSFMERNWLPLLCDSTSHVIRIDERGTLGPLHGALMAMMQLAEPLKLALYIGIPSMLALKLHYEPLARARAETNVKERMRQVEMLRANAERAAKDALAGKLIAEEATSRARKQLAEALTAQLEQERLRLSAEAESRRIMSEVLDRRQAYVRDILFAQVEFVRRLPRDLRERWLSQNMILLDGAIAFAFDRMSLTAGSLAVLDRFVDAYRHLGIERPVSLTGTIGRFCLDPTTPEPVLAADQTPAAQCRIGYGDAYSQLLSRRLAERVRAHLVSRGVPSERMTTIGNGEGGGSFPYPVGGFAKAWNTVASFNNEVKLRLQ